MDKMTFSKLIVLHPWTMSMYLIRITSRICFIQQNVISYLKRHILPHASNLLNGGIYNVRVTKSYVDTNVGPHVHILNAKLQLGPVSLTISFQTRVWINNYAQDFCGI